MKPSKIFALLFASFSCLCLGSCASVSHEEAIVAPASSLIHRENTSSSFSGLTFTLNRETDFANKIVLTINVKNTSTSSYSFGWVNSCSLMVRTKSGIEASAALSGGTINPTSNKNYNFTVDCGGAVDSAYFSDIRLLNGGLPVEGKAASMPINCESYKLVNGWAVVGIVAGAMAVLLTVIGLLAHALHKSSEVAIGITIFCIAITDIIYSFFSLITKPMLRSVDFASSSMLYFSMFAVGIALVVIGVFLFIHGKFRQHFKS
jgi:hypothetical protein